MSYIKKANKLAVTAFQSKEIDEKCVQIATEFVSNKIA